MERIKVLVETMDWMMGELGHSSIIVRKNAYVTVDWGDGSPLQTIIGTGERQDPDRDYKHRLPIRQFEVVITAQEEGTILHIYLGLKVFYHPFPLMRSGQKAFLPQRVQNEPQKMAS